jgi:hypothetical protein
MKSFKSLAEEFLAESASKKIKLDIDGVKIGIVVKENDMYIRMNKEVVVIDGADFKKVKALFK